MDDRLARGVTWPSSRSPCVGLSRLLEPPLGLARRRPPARRDAPRRRSRCSHDDPRRARPAGVPIESLILPSVAAVACLGAIRLVPFGLWLVPALVADLPHRRPDARARGRIPAARGRARRRRPDGGPGHDPARRVPRLHRRRGDGPRRPRAAGAGSARRRRNLARPRRRRRRRRLPARLSRGGAAGRRRPRRAAGRRSRTARRSRSGPPRSGRWRSRACSGRPC